jgi:outer membrane protein
MKWLVAVGWLAALPALAAVQGDAAWTPGVLTLEPAVTIAAGQGDAAPTAEVLTLEQAVTIALQQNRDVQSAALEVGKAEALRRANQTSRLPGLEVGVIEAYALTSFDLKFRRGDLGTLPGVGPVPAQDTTVRARDDFYTSVLARATQPVSQQYKIGLQLDKSALQERLAGTNLKLTQSSTVASVKEAYYQVLMAQTALEAAEEYAQALRELERVVTEQVQREAALRADLLDIQSRLAGAEANVLSARNTVATRKEQLNLWLGRSLDTDYHVSPVATMPAPEPKWDEARSRALRQRAEVARARLNLQSAETDVKLKYAEYIPDLNVVLLYTSPVTSRVLPQNIAYAGIELKWEFFDWGRKRQEVAARANAVAQADRALRQAQDQVALDLQSQLRRLQESQAQFRAADLGHEAARERLRVVQNRFASQAALLKDALQAQADLADANDRYAKALLGAWTARAEVDRALGEVQ